MITQLTTTVYAEPHQRVPCAAIRRPAGFQVKQCSKCKVEKSLSEFYKDKQKSDGFSSACRTCMKAQSKSYRNSNPEKVTAKNKLWREKNLDKCAEYSQKYRTIHPDKTAESRRATYHRNPERYRAMTDDWAARNPEKRKATRRVYRINKRARLKGAEGRFNAQTFEQTLIAQGHKCFWCATALTEENLHRDHYIPLARGGSNDTSNFVASCANCNRDRRDQMPEDYLAEKRGNA